MPSPAIALACGYRPLATYDPLALSGLLYFVHTDDSTVSAGAVASINDRVAAYVFAQGTAANRPIADTTTVTGHTVWKFDASVTTRKWLTRNGAALAGQFNGAPALSMFVYMRDASHPSAACDYFGHTTNTTSYTTAVRFATQAPTGLRFIENAAGSVTTYIRATAFTSSWALVGVTSDGAGNVKFWADGVQIGLTVSSTHRSPAAMTDIVLGDAVVLPGGATRTYYIGGYAAFLGQLSAADQVNLSNWFASSFA